MSRDEQFAEFVSARYRSLMRTALLLAGDAGHAEDLVQSALVKTYLAWARLRAPENANAYASRALVRLAVRARQRRWQREIPVARAGMSVAATASPLELAIDVRRALASLPAGQRAVLVLRYLDDRSEAETAQLLGISPGTVKSRASRGLAGLRKAGLLDLEGGRTT